MDGLYEIRKGVPAPASSKQPGLTKCLRKMEYMDSIVIPGDKISSAHPCAAQIGIRLITQKNSDGTYTLWRVDLPDVPPPERATASPKIEKTRANPALGLPDGYYIQEDFYGPRIWMEGKPPTEAAADSAPTEAKQSIGV